MKATGLLAPPRVAQWCASKWRIFVGAGMVLPLLVACGGGSEDGAVAARESAAALALPSLVFDQGKWDKATWK